MLVLRRPSRCGSLVAQSWTSCPLPRLKSLNLLNGNVASAESETTIPLWSPTQLHSNPICWWPHPEINPLPTTTSHIQTHTFTAWGSRRWKTCDHHSLPVMRLTAVGRKPCPSAVTGGVRPHPQIPASARQTCAFISRLWLQRMKQNRRSSLILCRRNLHNYSNNAMAGINMCAFSELIQVPWCRHMAPEFVEGSKVIAEQTLSVRLCWNSSTVGKLAKILLTFKDSHPGRGKCSASNYSIYYILFRAVSHELMHRFLLCRKVNQSSLWFTGCMQHRINI